MELTVSIEVNGEQNIVGYLRGHDYSDTTFQYDSDYMSCSGRMPVSLSLPFRGDAFDAVTTRRFFEGLLPEGFTRKAVAQWLHFSEDDYVSILHSLGKECLGAIRISDKDDSDDSGYSRLSVRDVARLAGEGAVKSAEMVVGSHLSLAGATGKVGLYYDGAADEWYQPTGLAPSTHIVKQSHVRLDGIVLNEQFCLLTAKKCGIKTSNSFIVNTGKGNDREVLLASERYDRRITGSRKQINGLAAPLRLHQEDFAQALGISSSEKYEKLGDAHMKKAFDLLRRYSSSPIEDQLQLWNMIIFNCLIGNTDGHLKNFSLLYSPDMKSIRLAPAYDIISTVVYPASTRNMAFAVGGDYLIDDISEQTFRKAAKEAGLGEKMALGCLYTMLGKLEESMSESASILEEQGFSKVHSLQRSILENGIAGKIK